MHPKPAVTEVPLQELLRERWSPRAFDTRAVSAADLDSLVEAARWAPSAMNEQPWNLLIGDRARDPQGHARILSTLVPANAAWAERAPVLAIAVARMAHARNGVPNPHAWYDTGQAIAGLTVEATARGLVVHQMGGFDRSRAREVLGIPEGYEPVVAIAIGYAGDAAVLSEELRRREEAPRARRPVAEWAFGAGWGTSRTAGG